MVGASEQTCVRRSRIDDDADVGRTRIETRRDLVFYCVHGLAREDLAVLRVTGGQLWKQDIDRIEFWNDMTHDQAGAEVIGEVSGLSQRFV